MKEWVQAQIDNMGDYDYLAMEADEMESKEVADESVEATNKEDSKTVRGDVGRGENVGMFTPLREEPDEDEKADEVVVEEE
jgi:hypothetical protein